MKFRKSMRCLAILAATTIALGQMTSALADEHTHFAINNRGQIVGWSTAADGTQHATLWDCNTIIDLTSKTLSSMPFGFALQSAVAINDKGQIAANGNDY